jgi:hypothetical protein
MAIGFRYFVVGSDDTVERWAQTRFNRVWDGSEPLPEFAARRLRYALVVVETHEREVIAIRGVEWNVMEIGPGGKHDRMAAMRDAVAVTSAVNTPYPSPIADARRRFYNRRVHWEPTRALRAAVLGAVLSGRTR